MTEASTRLLQLLSLLGSGRDWTSTQLAERLDVTTRTIRTDIGKLRDLGYPVRARPGAAGGYRLAAGTAMPPLLLDDDEAVAVAVGLRTVATRGLGVTAETSLTALAKLEQVLPSRLRQRISSVAGATSVVGDSAPRVDTEALSAIAAAVRGAERLRFGYTSHDGTESVRVVEPHRVVNWEARWYLLAWDLDRVDWRLFRVDRMAPKAPTGVRFRQRVIPEDAVTAHVVSSASRVPWRYRGRIRVHASAETVATLVRADAVVPDGPNACVLDVGSDDPDALAVWIAQLRADVDVLEGDELRAAFGRLSARFTRAAADVSTPGTPDPASR